MNIEQLILHLDTLNIDYKFLNQPPKCNLLTISSLKKASEQDVVYVLDKKHVSDLHGRTPGLVIGNEDIFDEYSGFSLVVAKPRYVFAKLAQELYKETSSSFIHSSSVVAENAQLSSNVTCEPGVFISHHTQVGEDTFIHANASIFENVKIGKNCVIGANVVIHKNCEIGDNCHIEAGTVIGGDGFGWEMYEGQWHKVPQVGAVKIGNYVSIGNNCCIDRGALEDTMIEDYCIIDNLVHIAHNVVIGKGSAVAGQVGFAGTSKLGQYNTVAGQAGFAGHLTTADQCHFLAKSGVTHSISEAGVYAGFPAQPHKEWQKENIRIRKLNKLATDLKLIQKQIQSLQSAKDEN
jgi:UDP-3-O-[3-hydroxymyristoyl] glucosamine N-acyltransferase